MTNRFRLLLIASLLLFSQFDAQAQDKQALEVLQRAEARRAVYERFADASLTDCSARFAASNTGPYFFTLDPDRQWMSERAEEMRVVQSYLEMSELAWASSVFGAPDEEARRRTYDVYWSTVAKLDLAQSSLQGGLQRTWVDLGMMSLVEREFRLLTTKDGQSAGYAPGSCAFALLSGRELLVQLMKEMMEGMMR